MLAGTLLILGAFEAAVVGIFQARVLRTRLRARPLLAAAALVGAVQGRVLRWLLPYDQRSKHTN